MTATLSVEMGERSYDIYFTHNDWEALKNNLARSLSSDQHYAVVTDENIEDNLNNKFQGFDFLPHPPALRITLKAGELSKSVSGLEKLYHALAENRIDRSGAIVAMGGGVIGDLAGFAAASYMRGIDLYQVPTTLLAMVDSSVGGKTGINLPLGKNLVGAFYQPRAVFIHTDFLQSLPQHQFNAGMAEVIKYGLLANATLFERLQKMGNLTPAHPELPEIIRQCCKIKASFVESDERESASIGGRALLNLGHTFAHAIEAVTGYDQYLHGEAVAVGLVMAARLSQRLGHLSDNEVQSILNILINVNLPIKLREPLAPATLINAMKSDKKVKHGKLHFIALEQIGKAVNVEDVPDSWIEELWLEAGAEGK